MRFPQQLTTRRALLRNTACGMGMIGLNSLLAAEKTNGIAFPTAPKTPHFAPRAKRVIFLFMDGGASHIDTFDPKPMLDRDHMKPPPFKLNAQFNFVGALMKSPWAFKKYGQMGMPVSELFPNVAQHVDKMCFLRSMVADGLDHGGALLQMHTGTVVLTRPSYGSWLLSGLGTENEGLPGFIPTNQHRGHSGVRNWSTALLPGAFQGTPIDVGGRGGGRRRVTEGEAPPEKEPIENLTNKQISAEQQRYELEYLRDVNLRQAEANQYDQRLEARLQSFELAFRMQTNGPDILDLQKESEATQKLYGMDDPMTRDYGMQLLTARRLVERGVRVVQCSHPGWDQHSELARRHFEQARMVDKPIAGLLADLEGRG